MSVRLYCNDGAERMGHTYTMGNTGSGAGRVMIERDVSPVLIGADSSHIEQLWEQMGWRLHYTGRGGIASFALSTVASLHLDMAINNCSRQELFINSLPMYQKVLTNPLVVEDGYGTPPGGPGWGTDLDEAALAKYPPAKFMPIEDEPYVLF